MNLSQYFQSIESLLTSYPFTSSVNFHTEFIDLNSGYYKAIVSFFDGSKLFLFEWVEFINGEALIKKYRYHFQDKQDKLICRWDNAPHFPELKTYPSHFHIGKVVKESKRPAIEEVLWDLAKHFNF